MTFQRARSDEQREARRETILVCAADMLDEMNVGELTLNELSRRVGLAKSNVLRYFESREAVLLELLGMFMDRWLSELALDLAGSVEPALPVEVRAEQVASTLSRTLANHKVLCDLLGAQGSVLERNISIEVAKRHKRSSFAKLSVMSDLLRSRLPELGDGCQWFCGLCLLSAGALATYVPAPPSLLGAYAEEPSLAMFNLELQDALRMTLGSVLLGVLPRP